MSNNNGVIRVGRKGVKKFAFGDDGKPFEVDIIAAMQEWFNADENFRQEDGPDAGRILGVDMPRYHQAAVDYVEKLSGAKVTIAEALDFLARLREQYDELADFFLPKKAEKRESPATSATELRFSVEEGPLPSSMS